MYTAELRHVVEQLSLHSSSEVFNTVNQQISILIGSKIYKEKIMVISISNRNMCSYLFIPIFILQLFYMNYAKYFSSSIVILLILQVSAAALAYIVGKNPGLTCLRVRDCKNLFEPEYRGDGSVFRFQKDFYMKLGRSCQFEDITFGWGFSYVSLDALKFALKKLRRITVGLGGSLGEDGLKLLAATCPLLDSVTLYFQVWFTIQIFLLSIVLIFLATNLHQQ